MPGHNACAHTSASMCLRKVLFQNESGAGGMQRLLPPSSQDHTIVPIQCRAMLSHLARLLWKSCALKDISDECPQRVQAAYMQRERMGMSASRGEFSILPVLGCSYRTK